MIKFSVEAAMNGQPLITRGCHRVMSFTRHDDNLFKYSALIAGRLWFKSSCDASGQNYFGDTALDLFLVKPDDEEDFQ